MNRYCYKTIYSKTLQRIIVVAEYARGEGKAGRSNITTYPIADSFCALRQLSWRIALATGSLLILPLAQAQIVADPQAPREHQPQVLLSTEQLPQVDIQTPSAAGVSVNEYRQFDVGEEGALLNNSRKGAPTHTGGWVSGNPNLIKGEAQVIVNQVNSSNPSQLRGQIEVAGQKADVIMANPAGISVNGGGFINAGKTWLTTGSPQLENGTFNGVNVERGTVHIGERGLDVRNTDYAAIIAKASKIDGPVQAGDRPLDVITGSNHVASDGKISGKGGSSTGSANTAIDTGQLGGMYGSSIRLISTDQGVGVNHAGAVQAQQLQISADGKLINRGSIDSDQLELDAHSLDNHGRISQGSGTLQVSAKTLDNAGSIRRNHVPENPKAQSGSDTAGSKTTAKSRGKDGHIRLKEGLDNRGPISSGSELHLQVAENLNNPGQLDVGALQVKDGETHNSGRIQAETATIRGNKLDNSGHFSASKHIDAATHEMDNSGVLMAPSLYLRGDNLNNSGEIIGTGSGSMQIWTADWNNYGHVGNSAGGSAPDNSNTDGAQNKTATRKQTGGSSAVANPGSDNSAGGSTLTFSHITNSGSISQSGGVDLNVTGTFTNRGEMTLKSLNYQGETLDNREGKIRSQTASVQATTLDNESGLFAAEHITRLDIQKLNNKNGVFYSGDDLRFSVAHFENPAGSTIGSGKTLSVKSPIVENDGRLFAGNVLEIEAQRLNNRGNLQGGALAIDTVELNNPGTIEQTGSGILTVKAGNLHNQKDGVIGTAPADKDKTTATDSHDAGAALAAKAGSAPAGGSGTNAPGHIAVSGKLDNSGRIGAAGGIRLETGEQFRNDGHIQVAELHSELGTLDNHGHLQAQSAWLQGSQLNNYGALIADHFDKFQYSGSVNNQGQIFGRADYRIDTPQLINGQDAKILGAGRLEIADSQIDNRGELRASTLVISGDGKLTNSGNVTGENTLQLSQKSTDNQKDGLLFGGQVIADGDTLHNHGRILAKQNLRIDLNMATNQGLLYSAGNAELQAKQLDNHGSIASNQLQLGGEQLRNDGQISGKTQLTFNLDRLDNHGQIHSEQSISGSIGTLEQSGLLASQGNLQLKLQQLNQQHPDATLFARNRLSLAVENAVQQRGTIAAGGALDFQAARLENYGRLFGGTTTFKLQEQLDNHGTISAKTTQKIDATTINNQGTLASEGSQHIQGEQLNNSGELIAASENLTLERLDNSGSIRQTGSGALDIRTASLNNQQGASLGENRAKPPADDDPQPNSNNPTSPAATSPTTPSSNTAGSINIKETLDNRGQIVAGGAVSLSTRESLHNDGEMQLSRLLAEGENMDGNGNIDATQATIRTKHTDIGGRFSGQSLDLDIETFTNRSILRFDHINWSKLQELSNYGDIDSKASLNWNMRHLNNGAGGKLRTAGTFDFKGETIENHGTLLSHGAQNITAENFYNNGLLATGDSQTLRAQKLEQGSNGEIDAARIDWKAPRIDNGGAVFITGNSTLHVEAPAINNRGIIGQTDVVLENRARVLSDATAAEDEAAKKAAAAKQQAQNPAASNGQQQDDKQPATLPAEPPQLADSRVEAEETIDIGNRGGFISNRPVHLHSEELDNSGKIRVETLKVDGKHFANHSGGKIDAETASITTPDIDNNGDMVARQLTLETERLRNGGTLASENSYDINASESVHNSGNLLSAAKLTINSPELHSTGGRISAVDLELNLLKRLANGGSIIARNLALNTPDITNSGLIYGEAGYQVRVDNLSNSGTLSSPAKISVAALHDRLDIHNSGNILARQTEVTADSLYGAGTVSGAEWAKVNVGSLGGGQSVTAGAHLELNVASDVDNHGTLGAAGQADINIPNLNNHGRVLAGEVLNLSTGQLNNHKDGLINTSGATNIQASSIDNLGRLYGDWVNLNASYLKNHGGGAIAAREHLDARINTIDNLRDNVTFAADGQAQGDSPIIKSDGTMLLSGQRLTNAGGIVQSAEDMALNGLQVKNDNPNFRSEQVITKTGEGKKYLRSLDPGSNGKLYDRDLFTEGKHHIFYSKDPSKTDGITQLNRVSEITADVSQEDTKIVTTTPGQIIAGGNLHLNHSHIENEKSNVTVGGVIVRNGGDITNNDADRTEQTFYDGDYRNTESQRRRRFGVFRTYKRREFGENAKGEFHENTGPHTDKMGVYGSKENEQVELTNHNSAASSDVGAGDGGLQRIESGGYVTIEGVAQQLPGSKLFNSDANNRDYLVQTDPDYIGGVVADVPAWRGPAAAQTANGGSSGTANTAPATGNRFDRVSANLAEQLQNRLNHIEGGLASINPADAPQNGVNFGVDERKIAALAPYTPSGIDPHDLHKRMGDIYAEMENLRRQYALQTGRGELPGEGDPIERYKALLNSGAEIIQRLGLTPGVALTAAQMQQLTGDTVIPVNRTIRLADGSTQQVTTLQLYSKKRAGDIDGRRTHISAEHITGKGGKLENHAIFNARGTNDATFSQVNNQGGTIQARDLHLQSEGDINNTAGTLRGRRSIDIKSGGKITNAATETAAHSTGNDTMRRSEQRLREGQIILDGEGQESEGYLRLHAKGDIEAKAGSIENRNAGSQTILSGANIRFGTQRTDESFTYNGGGESRVGAPARDSLHTRTTRDHGSTIKGKGDIILDAREGKITGAGADIDSSDGHVALFARDGIDLKNSWQDVENNYTEHSKKRRIFSKRESERYIEESGHLKADGKIGGKTVTLVAGRDMSGENTNGNADITLGGMEVISDKGTVLKATRDINLNAAEETWNHNSTSFDKKSGLTGSLRSAVINVGYRKSQALTTENRTLHNMKGTLVGSKEGDTTLIAGNTIHSRASNAIAGGDLNLLAKHIKIDVAGSEDREHSHSEGKSTGFGVHFDPKPSNWRMLFGAAKGFKEAKGDGLAGLAGKGVNAVTQGTIAKFDSPLRINYSHGNSEQDSTIHTYKNSGSNLFAQGKINAVATEGNIDVLGSHLYGGEGINLNAKHDVNILAAGGRTKQEGTSKQEVRGLEVGGLTNFIGKIRENGEMNSEQAATLSSRLESKGNINIHAGHHYNQNGSQVDAQGDVAVLAQKINVTAASNPYQGESSYTYQRKGLNIGISTPALSALQETGAAAQRMGQGSSRSSDLMSTATTAYKAYQAYKAVQNMNDPANGINIAVTYAVQRSKTENDYHGNTLTPSTIHAGGKVYLQAQGAGAESDINITGSDVAGKMGTHLKAEHQINLYAASEEHHENNYNQNYNAAAGIAARAGKNGVALGVTAEGGEGKGYSHANSNRWRGSHIGDADSQTTLQSGEATTLSGSQAIGKGVQIQASALNIESLQDTSDYKGRQEYKGAGGTLGWGYYSGALDYSRSKLQGDAALVNRQAGVYAGDDGFQIDVAGATKNRGGIITSSKAAEEAGLNRFSTATLELEDIENHRNLKGSSISTSLGYTDGMEQEGQLNRGLGGGYIRENAYDTSRASINTQNITIRDEVAQQALTGESVADTIARANQGIHTEDSAQHGSSLTAIDNGEKLQRQLEADAEITREFGKIAPRAINDIAESRGNLREYEQQQLAKAAAEEALTRTSDPAKRAALQNYINERDSYLAANKANYDYWKEGGSGRNLLHAASTALMSGTPEGALAGYTTSALSPTLNKLDNSLLNTIGGAAIGAAIGGNNPAVIAGAANTDWHNRQLHPTEMMLIEKNARTFAKQQGISEEEAISLLVGETLRGVSDDYADIKENQAARTFINQLPEAGKITNNGQHLFGVLDRESDEYRNSLYNIQHVEPNAKLYKQAPIVNNGFKDSTDYTLWRATFDSKTAYKKAGKEEVLGLFEGLEKRIDKHQQESEALLRNGNSDDHMSKAMTSYHQASHLSNAAASNYANASSLFTFEELYDQQTAFSRIASANIATGLGASSMAAGIGRGMSGMSRGSKGAASSSLAGKTQPYSQPAGSSWTVDKVTTTTDVGVRVPKERVPVPNQKTIDIGNSAKTTEQIPYTKPSSQPVVAETSGKTANTARATDKQIFGRVKCSFRGDMEVKTDKGFAAIASIRAGDKVWARNEQSGLMNYQSVLRTINSTDPDTAYLVVADQNGKQQTIVSDSKHPYFAQYGTDPTPPEPSPGKPYHGDIANAYWVNAANLETGHKLIDDSGNWHTVVSVRVEQKPLNSYNLEVENDHTFFIRGLGGDAGIWVHNEDCWNYLPKGAEPTGKTTPDGRPLYTFKDSNTGKYITVYEGRDGRFYNQRVHSPEAPTATNARAADPIPAGSPYNPAVPVPEVTRAYNGLYYQSHSKHTLGQPSYKKDAGIEPKNSFSLFERSEPFSETSKQRFTLEKDGSIHRFMPSNKEQTLWHWTGSTTDKNAPLNLSRSEQNKIRNMFKNKNNK